MSATVSDSASIRRIESGLLRALREERNMTLAQWAEFLGVPGGKSTVGAWETGSTSCQGLAAQVVLLRTRYQESALKLAQTRQEASALWNRVPGPYQMYRQMSFAFDPLPSLDIERFVGLLPRSTVDCGPHGFPLMYGLPSAAVTRSKDGWRFAVPISTTAAPAYLWLLKQELLFVYREWAWESDPMSVTQGHVDAGYTVLGAAQACKFACRLAQTEKLPTDTQVLLRLDLGGVSGWHFVDGGKGNDCYSNLGGLAWSEECQHANLQVPLQELSRDPLVTAIKLVVKIAAHAHPELAQRDQLLEIVKRAHKREGLAGQMWRHLFPTMGT